MGALGKPTEFQDGTSIGPHENVNSTSFRGLREYQQPGPPGLEVGDLALVDPLRR